MVSQQQRTLVDLLAPKQEVFMPFSSTLRTSTTPLAAAGHKQTVGTHHTWGNSNHTMNWSRFQLGQTALPRSCFWPGSWVGKTAWTVFPASLSSLPAFSTHTPPSPSKPKCSFCAFLPTLPVDKLCTRLIFQVVLLPPRVQKDQWRACFFSELD